EKASREPLLIIVDDLHRAGGRMLEFIAEMVQRVNRVPMLMVFAGRAEPGWIETFRHATVIRLDPLSPQDASELGQVIGLLDADTLGALVERSGGNPLYLRELVTLAAAGGEAASLPPTLQS